MYDVTIKQLWGIAKSPELSMSGEELHLLTERETGKTSLKELTKSERKKMLVVLLKLKDPNFAAYDPKKKDRYEQYLKHGSKDTEEQRKKIYMAAMELGWDDKSIERSLRSMCQRMFAVSDVRFLNERQCSALIEALKSMKKRKEKANVKNDNRKE